MPIVPVTLIPGELADNIDWNNHASAIVELQNNALPTVWTTVPYATNWISEPTSGEPLEVRGTSAYAELHGVVQRTGATTVTSSTVGTVPLAFRPSSKIQTAVDAPNSGTQLARWRLDINTNGTIVVYGNWASGSNFFFTGCRWSLG